MHCLNAFTEIKTYHGQRLQSMYLKMRKAIKLKMLFKKNDIKMLRNAIKKCYKNASSKEMGLELPFKRI